MDVFFQQARALAEETAKRSQEFAFEAAKRSQDLALETAKRSQKLALETAKYSQELALETAKKSRELAEETAKAAGSKLKAFGVDLPNSTLKEQTPEEPKEDELLDYGITEELREFVNGLTLDTFKDFPLGDLKSSTGGGSGPEGAMDAMAAEMLPPWRERHATLVLQTVPEISHFRYVLCPRKMKESIFWRIYFMLVQAHIEGYEAQFHVKAEEKRKAEIARQEVEKAAAENAKAAAAEARANAMSVSTTSTTSPGKPGPGPGPGPAADGKKGVQTESTTMPASNKKADDLDAYLMGALDDDTTGGEDDDDDDDDTFDPDDFDQLVNSADVESDGDDDDGDTSLVKKTATSR